MDSRRNSGLVVDELAHDRLRNQSGSSDALVDDGHRNQRLNERLAFGAGPLASHIVLDREAAGQVVDLLRDVFADAL